ncbi:hypothetical protein PIB30_048443 [Stylosanthes scabra]|uniref:TIR domain-containing protein n=1 Tax=Stylosanthes scabra TaxID=79078 RepID=A0ABU6WKF1_9FABA|nr:hypothetical protein [Stylosanthes scabra]
MAASSSSPRFKYDVFISFGGLDTRVGFLSHLVEALRQKGIDAYVDDRLEKGDEIMAALFTAIEESRIALIIFSEGYASSKWCLKELVKITEYQKEKGQIVIPIFYNVEPSQVRHLKRSYAEAFSKHENNSEDDVDKWRTALNGVANLSGFVSKGSEALLVKEVVKRILKTLDGLQPTDDFLQGLVGIRKPLQDLKSLVHANGSNDVRVIGIWGMGGIGKSTIAKALFLSLRSEYATGYFLYNVRQQTEKGRMPQMKNKLLRILLEDKDLDAGVPNVALARVSRRLCHKKVVVVLDDVDNAEQVRKLVGGHGQRGWLGPGSRIIVTTRDMHVLRKEADDYYEVKSLGYDEALRLLTLHAFHGNDIPDGYNDVVKEIVDYAKGVPLALEVLGSSLYGLSVEEWTSQLEKLRKMPDIGIQKVLRFSYDGLDEHDQKLLLYIVCFFTCQVVLTHGFEDVKMLLEPCGFATAIGLRILQDRSLISTKCSWVAFAVHDLIRQMCQEIVVREKEKPGKRRHLWDPNDIYHVLNNDKGTESIETISLDISEINNLSLTPNTFASMLNLNLLRISAPDEDDDENYDEDIPQPCLKFDNRVHAREDHTIHLPYNLRLLDWKFCPFKSLQPTGLENLVQLRMGCSSLQKLWDGTQNLPNLRKVHSSVFSLPKLVKLNMNFCKRLESLSGTDLEGQYKSWPPGF